jgi:hypothetical protein
VRRQPERRLLAAARPRQLSAVVNGVSAESTHGLTAAESRRSRGAAASSEKLNTFRMQKVPHLSPVSPLKKTIAQQSKTITYHTILLFLFLVFMF